jgi:hypothetical protein
MKGVELGRMVARMEVDLVIPQPYVGCTPSVGSSAAGSHDVSCRDEVRLVNV